MLKDQDVKSMIIHQVNLAISKLDFSGETFEVDKCYINKDDIPNKDFRMYGAVEGSFVKNLSKQILPIGESAIRPIDSNIKKFPVGGEYVTIKEINGRHYYETVVSIQGSPNNNAAPGASSIGTGRETVHTTYGNTFERNIDIKPVSCCEGEVVHEGRAGSSIKLGLNHKNNSPNIKLRAGQGETSELPLEPVKENIETDHSSIYLTTDESIIFDGESVIGKNVLMKSDSVRISGKERIIINSPNLSVKDDEIKLGGLENTEAIVKGNSLKKLLDAVFEGQISTNQQTMVTKGTEVSVKLTASGGTPTPETIELGKEIAELGKQNVMLKDAIANSRYLSETVKTV